MFQYHIVYTLKLRKPQRLQSRILKYMEHNQHLRSLLLSSDRFQHYIEYTLKTKKPQ